MLATTHIRKYELTTHRFDYSLGYLYRTSDMVSCSQSLWILENMCKTSGRDTYTLNYRVIVHMLRKWTNRWELKSERKCGTEPLTIVRSICARNRNANVQYCVTLLKIFNLFRITTIMATTVSVYAFCFIVEYHYDSRIISLRCMKSFSAIQ